MFKNNKYLYWALIAGTALSPACSRSPMKARLDQNFVYNCSMELIDKGVNAIEAERVCTASHHGEMLEADRRGRVQPTAPVRAPAALAAPQALPAPVTAQQQPSPAPALPDPVINEAKAP